MRTKDEIIIFQNQSHLVQKYFNDCGICPTLLEIANATDLMVQYAMNGPKQELLKRFEDMEVYVEKLKQNNGKKV